MTRVYTITGIIQRGQHLYNLRKEVIAHSKREAKKIYKETYPDARIIKIKYKYSIKMLDK